MHRFLWIVILALSALLLPAAAGDKHLTEGRGPGRERP